MQIIISIKRIKSEKNYIKHSEDKKSILGIINYHSFRIGDFFIMKIKRISRS